MLPYFKVSAIKSDLDCSFLLPQEKEEFLRLRFLKRRIEWLNARYVAKQLISEKMSCDFQGILIYSNSNRVPFASVKGRDFRISLSHRDNLCGCAFNPNFSPYIGLDIEKLEKREKIWVEDFFDKDEKKTNLDGLISLWALKESVLKMFGLGLNVDIKEIKLKNGKITFSGKLERRSNEFKSDVNYKIYEKENYVIALSWI